MTSFSILITSPPYDSERSFAAQRFIENALNEGQSIDHVFFYLQGVYHANRLIAPPSDEYHYLAKWKELKKQHNLKLLVCVTAASKRGILSPELADETGANTDNLDPAFEQAGLGEFFTSLHNCTNLVQF